MWKITFTLNCVRVFTKTLGSILKNQENTIIEPLKYKVY